MRLYSTLFKDHKFIAKLYFGTALGMLLLGFGIALIMRWQLAYPGSPLPVLGHWLDPNHAWMPGGVLQPEFYNQLVAMHGSIMVFFAVVPILLGGFGNYLVPLMLGAPNLAFPRLAFLGYLSYLTGALTVLTSFFTRGGPASAGWTSYPPLSVLDSPGQSFWLAGMLLVYLSSLAISVNLLVSIVQLRAPGMHFMRLPYFVWSQGVAAFLLLLSFPSLAAASLLQWMDRATGSSFFLPSGLVMGGETVEAAGGGSALLWQHLFWFLAHPEVYVLLLPALGIIAEIIPNNARRPLWGYRGMVYATLFLGLMSFLVWAHHMYLTNMGAVLSRFFQVTTTIISVPSIVIGSSLVVTLWGGAIRFTPPMLFALAFLPLFAIGGLTGLPLALPSTNIVLHDTFYVVGHFHYIVVGGTLFAVFAGIYYWFPKVTGKRMSTLLAHLHFWPSLLLVNGIFFHMLLQGMAGVPRRMYDGGITYAHGQEMAHLHGIVTISAYLFALAQLPFIINLIWSRYRGRPAGKNPWHGVTLEWSAPSPPLRHGNFRHPVQVHRGPSEYSVPRSQQDFSPQHEGDGP